MLAKLMHSTLSIVRQYWSCNFNVIPHYHALMATCEHISTNIEFPTSYLNTNSYI